MSHGQVLPHIVYSLPDSSGNSNWGHIFDVIEVDNWDYSEINRLREGYQRLYNWNHIYVVPANNGWVRHTKKRYHLGQR